MLWLSRDKPGDSDIDVWSERPRMNRKHGTYYEVKANTLLATLCYEDFEKCLPSFGLKPGQYIPIAVLDLRKWDIEE